MTTLQKLPVVPPQATVSLRMGTHLNPAIATGLDTQSRVETTTAPVTPIGVDLDLRFRIAPDDWTAGACVVAQWGAVGNQRAISLTVSTGTTKLGLKYSTDGTTSTSVTSGTLPGAVAGQFLTLRCTRDADDGAGNSVTKFWYSADYSPDTPTGGTWSLINTSTVATGGAAPFTSSTAKLQVGAQDVGTQTTLPFVGKVAWVQVLDSIGGNVIAQLDNRKPWFGYADTPGYYKGTGGNRWTAQGFCTWVWDGLVATPLYGPIANRPSIAAVQDGAEYLATDVNGGTRYQAQSGSWQQVGASVLSDQLAALALLTTPVDFSNDTTEHVVMTATTVPAIRLAAGVTVLDVVASGFNDFQATSGTYTFRLRHGSVSGTILASVPISPSMTVSGTGVSWEVRLRVVITATGSGGTVNVIGPATLNTSASSSSTVLKQQRFTGVAVDLSAGLTLVAGVIMQTASASNHFRVDYGSIRQSS